MPVAFVSLWLIVEVQFVQDRIENGVCVYTFAAMTRQTKAFQTLVDTPSVADTQVRKARTMSPGRRANDVILVPVSGQNDIVIELMSVAIPEPSMVSS
jgi:hypothetical protein